MKHLIIYYSYMNHTRELVKRLQNKFSYDVFEIEPVIPYSNNYQQVVDEALFEKWMERVGESK